ncbi:DNA primase large subunit, partial [Aureobasidium melanogenum]|uniref:DNA primase large subunit n=1 Tax=Aureobasidium melanogenum (strain CBS 110374) TaxID=1043003 RepID=A0A074WSA4_AURM1
MLAARPIARLDNKRRAVLDPRKRQFAKSQWQEQSYEHAMNFYNLPPTGDIALEQFEEWGIARLKVLAELESCQFRNRTAEETSTYMKPILDKYLRLDQNSSRSTEHELQRKRDHYSHWTLRLAFSATEELRKRFARLETQLFRLRLNQNDARERREFIQSLNMSWETVSDDEKARLLDELKSATGVYKNEEESWFKVDWENVPELVEQRKVLLKMGKAFVHMREQTSMVVGEFSRQLEAGLELAARALPRMDEDNRLSPILTHLSKSFASPDSQYNADASSISDTTVITANMIDALASHFPLCMQSLHRELRKNSHLKHFARLQYTLFLKGIGLDMNECIVFWRKSFKLMTDDKFKKEYLYNIRHAYGDVGGDSNRRGRGYTPYSCQKLITDVPSSGQSHGCPYRWFSPDNLMGLLQATGVSDREVLKSVKEDVTKTRYHIACNRVFEYQHRNEIKKVKDNSLWPQSELDTITHPNTYFKRSFLLKNLNKFQNGDIGVDGPSQDSQG